MNDRLLFGRIYRSVVLAVVLVLVLASLVGCGSTTENEFRYYLIDAKTSSGLMESDITLQIKDLSVPKYLERFQIVKRSGDNVLSYSDLHQWGEHLQKNLLRTLAMNLSAELGTADIGTPENRLSLKPRYQLRVLVERFEQSEQGELVLIARYQITQVGVGAALKTKLFRDTINNSSINSYRSNSYRDMVASMSTLFHRLSLEIAADLQALEQVRLRAISP